MKILILYLIINVLIITTRCDDSTVYFYSDISNCKSNEFYNVDYLKCQICDNSLNLMPHKNRQSCVCNRNSDIKYEYDNILQHPICESRCENATITCEKAPASPSQCRYKYFNYSSYNLKTKNIQIYSAATSRRTGGETSLSTPSAVTTRCDCNLKSHSIYLNEYCIPNTVLKDFQGYANYRPNNNSPAAIFTDLKYLVYFCHQIKNSTACNQLANLCVLSYYSTDKYSPCHLFYQATQSEELANGNSDDSEYGGRIRPSIFYRRGKQTVERADKFIDEKYELRGDKNVLNLTKVVFEVGGSLRSQGKVEFDELNLCGRYAKVHDEFLFGETFDMKCELRLKNLIHDFGEMLFNDLYFDYSENGVRFLKSVPILIKNLFSYNTDSTPDTHQYVKRFFIIDTITGLKPNYKPHPLQQYSPDQLLSKYNFVRCISSINLNIQVNDNGDEIATPKLILEYTDLNISSSQYTRDLDVTVPFQFSITYTKHHSFGSTLEVILPVTILLSFIAAIVRAMAFKTRQNKIDYDFEIFGYFFIQLCSNLATSFFVVAIILVATIFCVYKSQTVMTILLPVREQELIEAFIYLALVLKLIKLIEMVYQISNIDIFFIDWERPKIFENHHHMAFGMGRNNLDTPSMCSSVTKNTSFENVSAWRNYFIANEWQELTTKRKISIYFHIILVSSTLLLFGFEHWSSLNYFIHFTTTKTPHTPTPPRSDTILSLAVGIMIYTASYVFLRLCNFVIRERFFENSIQQFIDVCSIANISVFILFLRSYGFYIHGRSPHGFSDTDMCSMIIQFKREENNMCGHRGLMTGSEQQTYSILAPSNLRSFYDKLITSLQKPNTIGSKLHYDQLSQKSYEVNFEKTVHAYYNINRFFGAFIDHALKDLDYIIKEQSILEWMLDCELDVSVAETKGTFYIDNGHSFDRAIFYGNENLLFQFELMLFSCVLISFKGNYLLAIISVGLIYKIIEATAKFTTKTNLAKKTLIDKRFLF